MGWGEYCTATVPFSSPHESFSHGKQSTKPKKQDFCEAVTLASRLMTFAARNKIKISVFIFILLC